MGFIKELIMAFMEGINEGKQEWEEEEKKQEKNKTDVQHLSPREELLLELQNIPYEEQFAMGIAAPFRVAFWGDWYTVFDEPDRYNDLYPLHLFTFAREGLMADKEKKRLKKALKRDFAVENSKGCYLMFEDWWKTITDGREGSEACPQEVIMWLLSTLAYAVTSSADVGYISKEDAIPWLNRISEFLYRYDDNFRTENPWHTFGMFVLMGDDMLGVNKGGHGKMLEQYIGYLKTKPGSPWNLVPFKEEEKC